MGTGDYGVCAKCVSGGGALTQEDLVCYFRSGTIDPFMSNEFPESDGTGDEDSLAESAHGGSPDGEDALDLDYDLDAEGPDVVEDDGSIGFINPAAAWPIDALSCAGVCSPEEIASILTHITDETQNHEYFDRYFASVPIDLSRVLFVFSYNDPQLVDRILRDRLQEIEVKPYTINDKVIITKKFLLKDKYSCYEYFNKLFKERILNL